MNGCAARSLLHMWTMSRLFESEKCPNDQLLIGRVLCNQSTLLRHSFHNLRAHHEIKMPYFTFLRRRFIQVEVFSSTNDPNRRFKSFVQSKDNWWKVFSLTEISLVSRFALVKTSLFSNCPSSVHCSSKKTFSLPFLLLTNNLLHLVDEQWASLSVHLTIASLKDISSHFCFSSKPLIKALFRIMVSCQPVKSTSGLVYIDISQMGTSTILNQFHRLFNNCFIVENVQSNSFFLPESLQKAFLSRWFSWISDEWLEKTSSINWRTLSFSSQRIEHLSWGTLNDKLHPSEQLFLVDFITNNVKNIWICPAAAKVSWVALLDHLEPRTQSIETVNTNTNTDRILLTRSISAKRSCDLLHPSFHRATLIRLCPHQMDFQRNRRSFSQTSTQLISHGKQTTFAKLEENSRWEKVRLDRPINNRRADRTRSVSSSKTSNVDNEIAEGTNRSRRRRCDKESSSYNNIIEQILLFFIKSSPRIFIEDVCLFVNRFHMKKTSCHFTERIIEQSEEKTTRTTQRKSSLPLEILPSRTIVFLLWYEMRAALSSTKIFSAVRLIPSENLWRFCAGCFADLVRILQGYAAFSWGNNAFLKETCSH